MSWQAQAWAIEMGKRFELDPGHRWMLMILANYADPEGNDIYPSNATLMADTGFGESTVRRHIKHLIGCGLMEYGNQAVAAFKVKRADRRPKVYRLLMTEGTGFQTGGHGDTPQQGTGFQNDPPRGSKRGVTVTPKPINLKDKPAPAEAECKKCERLRPVDVLSASGICADCLGIVQPAAAAQGAAFREQIRLKRLAQNVGAVP